MRRTVNTSDEQASRWLAADARGDEQAAEAALGALFATLPAPTVPAGFAARLLLGLPRRRRWRFEAVVAAVLAACAAAVWVAPLWLTAAWERVHPERLVGDLLAPLVQLDRWLTGLASVWRGLAEVSRLAQVVAASPQGMTTLALSLATVTVAVRLLYDLLDERSPLDVSRA